MATARFGNFALSAAFGGLLPSLFNLQVDPWIPSCYYVWIYQRLLVFLMDFLIHFMGDILVVNFPQASSTQGQQADSYLKTLLLILVGVFVTKA